MRFALLQKLVTYLMVTAALAALFLSPDWPRWIIFLCGGALTLSWFAEPARFNLEKMTPFWNGATMIFFLYLLVEVVLRLEAAPIAGANFLLLVLVNKLFNRRTSKDYQQIYIISFLIIVVATTLNTDLSYAISFIFYVVFTTWMLILLHLRREIEEHFLGLKPRESWRKRRLSHLPTSAPTPVATASRENINTAEQLLDSSRLITSKFLLGTSVLSLVILLGSATFFVFFPRLGFGLFATNKRMGVGMVGFRERVELGYHGTVRDNPQVMMRVIFPNGKNPGPLHWRGSVFDRYDRGVWSHSEDYFGLSQSVSPRDRLYILNHAPLLPSPILPALIREKLLRQDIYLEPLDSTLIFGADRPVAVEMMPPLIGTKPYFVPRRGPLSEIRGDKMRLAGVKYTVYSQPYSPTPDLLRKSAPLNDARWSNFLQIPAGLPARIGELARKITAPAPTVYDKVIAIRDYLQQNYRYTLKLQHDPKFEPVDEFLFELRAGHCEYFASAMALLLRQVGIHTRSVNGFAGGAWNEYGKYLAVRQGDAHSWVEVLFDGYGWITFDPTPPEASSALLAPNTLGRLQQFLDNVRMQWFRYVIEYDLDKQASFYLNIARALKRHHHPHQQKSWLATHKRELLLGLLVLVALISLGIWRYYGWRLPSWLKPQAARNKRRPLQATMLYQKMLTLLAQVGQSKSPAQTPAEFARILSARRFFAAELVGQITACYYEARFQSTMASAAQLNQLQQMLRQLKQRLQMENSS